MREEKRKSMYGIATRGREKTLWMRKRMHAMEVIT